MGPIERDGRRYSISATLANVMLAAIVAWALGVAAYMVDWNRQDAAWKARMEQKHDNIDRHIEALHEEIRREVGNGENRAGILHRRIDNLEAQFHEHEREERRGRR